MQSLARISFVWISVFAVCLPGPLSAAPEIRVRGKSTIHYQEIRQLPTQTLLIGILRDASLRHGIADAWVRMAVLNRTGTLIRRIRRAKTDEHGQFSIPLPQGLKHAEIRLRYRGNKNYRSAQRQLKVEVTKGLPELSLDMPTQLRADQSELTVQIDTAVAGNPVDLPLTLSWPGQQRKISTRSGTARIKIPSAELGQPGVVRFSLHYAGNEQLGRMTVHKDVSVLAPTFLTLEAVKQQVRAGETITVTGLLRDPSGPIGGATISLQSGARPLAALRTDSNGRFRGELATHEERAGKTDMVAQFTPSVPWRAAAKSATLTLNILPPKPIPLRIFLVPLLLSLALLGIVRYYPRKRPEADVEPEEPERPPVLTPGLHQGKASRLHKPILAIDGQVVDAHTGGPIAATITVAFGPNQAGQIPATIINTGDDGQFNFVARDAGTYKIVVQAEGYAQAAFDSTLPHRGQLSGVSIALMPHKLQILATYREIALPLLPKSEHWARWTPRDLLKHLGSRAETSFTALSKLVERTFWSRTGATDRQVAEAKELADKSRVTLLDKPSE